MKTQSERLAGAVLVAMVATACLAPGGLAQTPFKLGVEERGYIQDPNGGGEYQYPAPQAVPTGQPLNGNVEQNRAPKKKQPPPKLQGGASDRGRPPMQMQIQKSVQLPQGFMGAWMVSGLRKEVQAQPQFQAAVPQIFAEQTQNVWTITGDPNNGYAFSNDAGVKSAIFVDKVQGDTAFIRYQHQIKNTVAQEAIVMQLVPGGAQFNGLERIKIVKQGEPPRCEVTYQLMGRRK